MHHNSEAVGGFLVPDLAELSEKEDDEEVRGKEDDEEERGKPGPPKGFSIINAQVVDDVEVVRTCLYRQAKATELPLPRLDLPEDMSTGKLIWENVLIPE